MAVLSGLTKPLAVPHEPGESITVKVLGWAALQRCEEAQVQASLGAVRAMGAEIYNALASRTAAASAPALAAPKERILDGATGGFVDDAPAPVAATPDSAEEAAVRVKYHRGMLFRESVVAWTYTDAAGRPIKVTPDNVEALDPETAEWLHRTLEEMYAAPAKNA